MGHSFLLMELFIAPCCTIGVTIFTLYMKNKILMVLSVLVGLMYLNGGLNKFFNYMPVPDLSPEMKLVFEALMTISWLLPLIAVVEIVGGILLLVPKTRLLGVLVTLPVLVGILIHHIVYDPSTLVIPVIFLVFSISVLIENKNKVLGLL